MRTKFSKKNQTLISEPMEIIDSEQNLDQKPLILDRISLKNHEIACFDRYKPSESVKNHQKSKNKSWKIFRVFFRFFGKMTFSHFLQLVSNAP